MPTTFCFDLDGTLCTNTYGEYDRAEPYTWAIERLNALAQAGHRIIVYTARGTSTGVDWTEETLRQLERWGVQYDELKLGKPTADVFVDDRAVHTEAWRWGHTVVMPGPGVRDPEREKSLRLGIAGLPPPGDVSAVDVGRTFGSRALWLEDHLAQLLAAGVDLAHDPKALIDDVRAAVEPPGGAAGATDDVVFTLSLAGSRDAAYLDVYEPDAYPAIAVSSRALAQPVAALARFGLAGRGAVAVHAATTGEAAWPLRDGDGSLHDGCGGALAAVRDATVLLDPPPRGPTVTRMRFAEIARGAGVAVEERPVSRGDLEAADEAFVVNVPFCVLPLRSVDGRELKDGEVSRTLLAAWSENVGIDVASQLERLAASTS